MTTQPSSIILPEQQKPWIIVAGYGRCGMSLMMQMLHAGGVPCAASWPAFETEEVSQKPIRREFFDKRPGRAVKVISPNTATLPPGLSPYIVIWCDRDVREQAKSWRKFLRHTNGINLTKADMIRLARSLEKDRKDSLIGQFGLSRKLIVSFEATLKYPDRAVNRIHDFIKPWWPNLNRAAMINTVIPRSPRCGPSLDVELGLTELALTLRECRNILAPALQAHYAREAAGQHRTD